MKTGLVLEGGAIDSIPVRKALEMGIEKPVVVLTRPVDYRKIQNAYLRGREDALRQLEALKTWLNT